MKSVLLFLRLGFSNRNLLRTDFLAILRAHPEIQVVVVSPIGDDPEFQKEFRSSNVCIEKWPRTKVGFWEKRLKNLKDYIWVSRGFTQAIRVRRLAQLGWWGLALRDIVGRLARKMGMTEQHIHGWELRIYRSHREIQNLYDKHQPHLVVFTRPFGNNVHFVKEAKMRGIPVLCLVESWDNLICKGPLSIVPDRMAVWNEGMKMEAHQFHGFPLDKVDIVGAPQFDLYADVTHLMERQAFFRAHGLDPDRKLVVYGLSQEGFIPGEIDIVEDVYRALQAGQLGIPAQLLVRLHPITSPALQEEFWKRFEGRPHLVLQRPGRPSRLYDGWDPSWSDMSMLASTIHHTDVVVSIASTFTIDAAALDKPVICIGFGGGQLQSRSKFFRGIFDHSHYRKLVETGGIHLVYNVEELVDGIRQYLTNSTLDALGRKRLREELCYRVDGQSARRAALVVLRELGIDTSSRIKIAEIEKNRRESSATGP